MSVWNGKHTFMLSIAPSLELKLRRTIPALVPWTLSIAPSLELKQGDACAEGADLDTINRTIFGIETTIVSRFLLKWKFLSIAPSLELKRIFIDRTFSKSKPYQSHHLWNWNQIPQRAAGSVGFTINRTIFGIETLGHKSLDEMLPYLSIAPSLELKLSRAPFYCPFVWDYQSHHLWNWNCNRWAFPGQPACYQSHHLWNWNEKNEKNNRKGASYQSHHLWNWN